MSPLTLTALKYIASFLSGALIVGLIWSYVERGYKIDKLEASNKSKTAVIGLVTERGKDEKKITEGKDERIKELGKKIEDKTVPMSPAVRAAIDSLPN